MGVTSGCVKIIVFLFNLVFALAGIALITVGTIYKLNIADFRKAIPDTYTNVEWAPTLTIIVGSIVFVIAFFGCCGAIRENTCLLTTYAIILLIIFLLQVAVGVFAFLEIRDKEDFDSNMNRTIEQIFSEYHTNNQSKEAVDLMQKELHCCGVNGPSYWLSVVPRSCCKDENCSEGYYAEGCLTIFADFIHSSVRVIGITILCLSATEIIGAILSLCLSNSINNETRRGRY